MILQLIVFNILCRQYIERSISRIILEGQLSKTLSCCREGWLFNGGYYYSAHYFFPLLSLTDVVPSLSQMWIRYQPACSSSLSAHRLQSASDKSLRGTSDSPKCLGVDSVWECVLFFCLLHLTAFESVARTDFWGWFLQAVWCILFYFYC